METLNNLGTIVSDINNELYDQFENEEYEGEIYLELNCLGSMVSITFIGIQIWNSEDDPRPEIHEDILQPMEEYLRHECNKIIRNLVNIQL